MRQLLVDLPPDVAQPWPVPADLRHRLERVLRLADGATLQLNDGRGRRVAVQLVRGTFSPLGPIEPLTAPPHALELACGLIKGERWDWLVEKAVELGATRLQPLLCDHCVVQVDSAKAPAKVARWQSLANEALEQCGRPWVCTVAAPLRLAEWLAVQARVGHTVYWCDEQGGAAALDQQLLAARPASIVVAVAPEGGWSARERQALHDAKAQAATLSDAILRAETAALAALVMAQSACPRR